MTTRVDGINIKDGDITEAKLQTSLNPSGTIDSNAFNIGVLGFKLAVNDGLTVFNLVDGVVDEFHDNTGVDTAENSNAVYDATSDFFENKSAGPVPNTTEITSYTSGSGNYTAEPTTTNVNVLIVGGGGAGGGSASDGTGGGGAGGLIYYPNYPVTGGNSYAYVVGAGMGETPAPGGPHPTFGYNGADSSFNHPSPLPLVGEGGGKGGDSQGFPQSHFLGRPGGSGGGIGGKVPDMGVVPAYQPVGEKFGSDALPLPATGLPTTPSPQGPHYIGTSTQVANHPTGLSPSVLPVNSPGGFGNRGGAGSQATPQTPPDGHRDGGGGGGAGAIGNDNLPTEPQNSLNPGGVGLAYTIADGSSPVTYATGGNSGPEGVSGAGADASANTGNGGTGGGAPGTGGTGGSGIVIVSASQQQVSSSSMTLMSDTFTANTAPSTARIVIFAELGDDINSEISASVTRDNTTFNSVTLTDEGYSAGSSGIKIFSGSTPLTGSASPQVRLRWKIVGASLEGANKIHGVSLQWK